MPAAEKSKLAIRSRLKMLAYKTSITLQDYSINNRQQTGVFMSVSFPAPEVIYFYE